MNKPPLLDIGIVSADNSGGDIGSAAGGAGQLVHLPAAPQRHVSRDQGLVTRAQPPRLALAAPAPKGVVCRKNEVLLKGKCSENLTSFFLHQKNNFGPFRNRLGGFRFFKNI